MNVCCIDFIASILINVIEFYSDEVLLKRKHRFTHLQNFKMLLAICEKKLAIFASIGNYFRPWTLETSDFVHGSAMWSLSLVMSECSRSGRGQGHVSNFYIVDLENFATASCRYTGDIHNRPSSVCLWHLRQWVPTWSRHGWVHIVYHALPPTKSPTSYHRFG